MKDFNIYEHIISYREDANDYRLCLTKEQIDHIAECCKRYDLVKEIKELMKGESNES